MYQEQKIWLGLTDEGEKMYIYPKMANRHGLIAGATGTGKTVTLRTMAESFSDAGVPVFLADIKGDLSGLINPGSESGFVGKRMQEWNLLEEGFTLKGYPVTYWDVYGEKGVPLRTTISEMGPLLLGRILELNDTQCAILTVIFKIADDNDLLLIDTKDLKAMIAYVNDNLKDLIMQYGNMTSASLAAITRAIVALESQGGEQFFAEPALNIRDWFRTDCDGKGHIQILDCTTLVNNPTMYSTFLLWMLSDIYEVLPEAGDLAKPKMVFFFDEAHMLFNNASKALLQKIEQIVKLIRSKGVGIYFVTQNPKDVPDGVLAQLGNKIEHALHAYSPAEMKGVKIAAQAFRENPKFSTFDAIQNLGIGEALVSVLDEKGVPTIVEKTTIMPPCSSLTVISDSERSSFVEGSEAYLRYGYYVDNVSAYEVLMRVNEEKAEELQRQKEEEEQRKQEEKEAAALKKQQEKEAAALERQKEREEAAAIRQQEREAAAALKQQEKEAAALQKQKEKEAAALLKQQEKEAAAKKKTTNRVISSAAKSVTGTVGREVGKSVGNSIGGTFGKKIGGNLGASLGRGLMDTFLKR